MNKVKLAEIRAKKEADKALLKEALRPFAKSVTCSIARKPGRFDLYLFASIDTTADRLAVKAAVHAALPAHPFSVRGARALPGIPSRLRIVVHVQRRGSESPERADQ